MSRLGEAGGGEFADLYYNGWERLILPPNHRCGKYIFFDARGLATEFEIPLRLRIVS